MGMYKVAIAQNCSICSIVNKARNIATLVVTKVKCSANYQNTFNFVGRPSNNEGVMQLIYCSTVLPNSGVVHLVRFSSTLEVVLYMS